VLALPHRKGTSDHEQTGGWTGGEGAKRMLTCNAAALARRGAAGPTTDWGA
jgi:hypothetical protein